MYFPGGETSCRDVLGVGINTFDALSSLFGREPVYVALRFIHTDCLINMNVTATDPRTAIIVLVLLLMMVLDGHCQAQPTNFTSCGSDSSNATGAPWTDEQCAPYVTGNHAKFSVHVKSTGGSPRLLRIKYDSFTAELTSFARQAMCSNHDAESRFQTGPGSGNGTATLFFQLLCSFYDPIARMRVAMSQDECHTLTRHVNTFRCYSMFAEQSREGVLDPASGVSLGRIPAYVEVARLIAAMDTLGVSSTLLPFVEAPIAAPDPNVSSTNCTPRLAPPLSHGWCINPGPPGSTSFPALTVRFERIGMASANRLHSIAAKLEEYLCGMGVSLSLQVDAASSNSGELILIRATCEPDNCVIVHDMMTRMRCGVITTVLRHDVGDPAYNQFLGPLFQDLDVKEVSHVGSPEDFAPIEPCGNSNPILAPWKEYQCAAPATGNEPRFSMHVGYSGNFDEGKYAALREALVSYLEQFTCGSVSVKQVEASYASGTAMISLHALCAMTNSQEPAGEVAMTSAQCDALLIQVNTFRCYALFAKQSTNKTTFDAALAAQLDEIPDYVKVRNVLSVMGIMGVSSTLLPLVANVTHSSNTSVLATNCTPQLSPPTCADSYTAANRSASPELTIRFTNIGNLSAADLAAIGDQLDLYFCGSGVSLLLEVDTAAAGSAELLLLRATCNETDCPVVHQMMTRMRCGIVAAVNGTVSEPAFNHKLQPLFSSLGIESVSPVGEPEQFAGSPAVQDLNDDSIGMTETVVIIAVASLIAFSIVAVVVCVCRRRRQKSSVASPQKLHSGMHAAEANHRVKFSDVGASPTVEMDTVQEPQPLSASVDANEPAREGKCTPAQRRGVGRHYESDGLVLPTAPESSM